ncbi:hypothetical protein [Anaerostipes sp. PC18]|uniref:hypothetical protein n=1 Tax=Anaerostipes sp. PC18 TaxID=3036926 RepID=UPI0030935CC3|nr:hypothetical protein P8F77_16890 [Anaerostipes sp. PC18]
MSFSALFPSHFVVESLRAVTVNPERSTVCADTLLFMTAPSRPITIIGVEEKASVKFTLASTVEEAFTLTLPRFINIFLFANLSSCELVLSKLVLSAFFEISAFKAEVVLFKAKSKSSALRFTSLIASVCSR